MRGPDKHVTEILESITDAFFALDEEWRFTYLNAEAEKVLLKSRGELLGKNVWEEFPAAIDLAFGTNYYRTMRERVTVEFQEYYPPLETWFEVRSYPVADGIAVYFRDINERRRSEEQLRILQRAVESSSAATIVTDPSSPDDPIVYANPTFERMTGYSGEEVLGHNCRFLQGGDRDQPELASLRSALAAGREWSGVLRNYRKDGTLFYNEIRLSPVRDGEGAITHYIGVQTDITERVEAEQARAESERRLRSVLTQYGSEMITILDPDGTPRYESPAVRRALGYEHMQSASGDLTRFVHPEDRQRLLESARRALATPGVHPPVEYRIRQPTAPGSTSSPSPTTSRTTPR